MSNDSTRVITGKVRFSYAHVWQPKAIDESSPAKYSVAILIPKSDTPTLKRIERAFAAAKENGRAKWGGKIPATIKNPLKDGDVERPDDPVYENCFFINANSNNAPQIVDAERNPIIDESEFYSGCYGRASFNLYPYSHSVKKGVACGLGNLQKLEEGERLSGGASAEDDFGDDDGGLF